MFNYSSFKDYKTTKNSYSCRRQARSILILAAQSKSEKIREIQKKISNLVGFFPVYSKSIWPRYDASKSGREGRQRVPEFELRVR